VKLCGIDHGGIVAVKQRGALGAHPDVLCDPARSDVLGWTSAIRREIPKRLAAVAQAIVAASVATPWVQSRL
jgi:hypothetical protein